MTHSNRIIKGRWIAGAAVVALLAGACGGGSSGGDTSGGGGGSVASGGQVVEIDVASSGFAFAQSTATASAGHVTIKSMNPQGTGHDIALRGDGVDEKGEVVQDGGVSTIDIADLKPGTYTYYCSVPGHEDAGMKGTLTVS
ncbi:MAG TPA: plastocyanin/azurin family copper-binding protein [Gaiellales bacterium]|jgi:plastocyanin|nr:plastocyanin/azurin family copper-binding protein [Gaiellales bacterium]